MPFGLKNAETFKFNLKSLRSSRGLLIFLVLLSLFLIVFGVAYALAQEKKKYVQEAELRTSLQARILGEYSRVTFKRIDEIIVNNRREWRGDKNAFAKNIERTQRDVKDIAFQVATIDRDGFLAYSNLPTTGAPLNLSQREHFQIHYKHQERDELFISKPVLGKVSGKWSIQFTRPIHKEKSSMVFWWCRSVQTSSTPLTWTLFKAAKPVCRWCAARATTWQTL